MAADGHQYAIICCSFKISVVVDIEVEAGEGNTEADDLTNEKFSAFDALKRIHISLADVDTSIISDLVQSRGEFESKKEEAKAKASRQVGAAKKRFDKTQW